MQERVISFNKSRMPLTFCVMAFVITNFINIDFDIKYIYNYALLALLVFVELFFCRKIALKRITFPYFLLVLVVAILSLLPNALHDPETQNHTISMLVFFGCYVFAMPSKREHEFTKKALNIAAVLMALYTIVIKIYPSLYWNSIHPHLSEYVQGQARLLMKIYNYGVPIGGTPNYVDYVLSMALFVLMGKQFSKETTSKETRKIFLLSGLFLVAMVIQNRRSELIAAVLAVLLMYSMTIKLTGIELKRFRRLMEVAAFAVIAIIVMYFRGMLDRFIGILDSSGTRASGLEAIGNGRIALWIQAASLFRGSPLTGIGWNQFRERNFLRGMEGIHVHNDYLQWLCESGVIGFVLIAIPTFYIWFQTIKRYRYIKMRENFDKEARQCALISIGIQTFFIIMHLFDPCFYKLLFWPMYAYSMIMYNMSFQESNHILERILQ